MKLPDLDTLLMAVEESQVGMTDIGYCINCGLEHLHIEPDAREYECESCGEFTVYGAEELLLMTSG